MCANELAAKTTAMCDNDQEAKITAPCETEQAAKTTSICDNEQEVKITELYENEQAAKTTSICDNEREVKITALCENEQAAKTKPLDLGGEPECAQQNPKPSSDARVWRDIELNQMKTLYDKMVAKYHRIAIERNNFKKLLQRIHRENVQFKATVQRVTKEVAKLAGHSAFGKRVAASKNDDDDDDDDTNAATLDEGFTILTNELHGYRKRTEDMTKERAKLDKQLTVERKSFDDQLTELQIRFDRQLIAERGGVETQLAAERSRGEVKLVAVLDRLAAAEKLLAESEVREDGLRKSGQELTEQCETLAAERDQLTAERDQLTAERDSVRRELDLAKSKIQRQTQELQTTVEMLRAEAKADRSSMAESSATQRADIERLTVLLAAKSKAERCLRSRIIELEEMTAAGRSANVLPSCSSLMLESDGQSSLQRGGGARHDENCNRTAADHACNGTAADHECNRSTTSDDNSCCNKRTAAADNCCNNSLTITGVDASRSSCRVSSAAAAGGSVSSSLPALGPSAPSSTDTKMAVYVSRDVAELIDKCSKVLACEPEESASALQRRVMFDVHRRPQTSSSRRSSQSTTDVPRMRSSKTSVLEEDHIVNHVIRVYQHGGER